MIKAVEFLAAKVIDGRNNIRRQRCKDIREGPWPLSVKANEIRLEDSKFEMWLDQLRKDIEANGVIFADGDWDYLVSRALRNY
jgi:hypothetical protein